MSAFKTVQRAPRHHARLWRALYLYVTLRRGSYILKFGHAAAPDPPSCSSQCQTSFSRKPPCFDRAASSGRGAQINSTAAVNFANTMAAFGAQPGQNPTNPGDMEVANAATDGISCVTWSPTANFLAVASWDHQIRVWDVQASGQAVPKAATSHDGPVLCAAWSSDGARVFTGSCDKTAKVWDLATSSHTQVAVHDAPIKNIFWVQVTEHAPRRARLASAWLRG